MFLFRMESVAHHALEPAEPATRGMREELGPVGPDQIGALLGASLVDDESTTMHWPQ